MRTNEDLVEDLREFGIPSSVLDAFRKVDRAHFVPRATDPTEVYSDVPISIPHGQTTSQPFVIASMVAAVGPNPSGTALEVGTGYGYQTAILSGLFRRVVSVERHRSLALQARERLRESGIANVQVFVGDGSKGVPSEAPFDGIVVAAAAREVPEPLASQLRDGGRLTMPVGPGGDELVVVYERQGGSFALVDSLFPASFVPLVGEGPR